MSSPAAHPSPLPRGRGDEPRKKVSGYRIVLLALALEQKEGEVIYLAITSCRSTGDQSPGASSAFRSDLGWPTSIFASALEFMVTGIFCLVSSENAASNA